MILLLLLLLLLIIMLLLLLLLLLLLSRSLFNFWDSNFICMSRKQILFKIFSFLFLLLFVTCTFSLFLVLINFVCVAFSFFRKLFITFVAFFFYIGSFKATASHFWSQLRSEMPPTSGNCKFFESQENKDKTETHKFE